MPPVRAAGSRRRAYAILSTDLSETVCRSPAMTVVECSPTAARQGEYAGLLNNCRLSARAGAGASQHLPHFR